MKLSPILAAAFLTLTASSTHASLFTWSAPTNISGDSDVNTTGVLVGAVNLGSGGVGSTTVNGVNFTGLAASGTTISLGNFSISSSVTNALGGSNFVGAPSGFSAGYQALLNSELLTFSGSDAVLTMSGLVSGETYLFQWWANESNSAASNTTTATSEGQTVSLSSRAVGDRGQFATATFTADATGTQVISFGGAHRTNGFQLRQLVPAAVPEPGTALAGLALLGLCGMRRRR